MKKNSVNLLIFSQSEIVDSCFFRAREYQCTHILKVLKGKTGDIINVGELNGNIGTARIEKIDESECILKVDSLELPSPSPIPLTLIVALPRPQMIKRILQTVAMMGVKQLIFFKSARVEKSFWQSPVLQESEIQKQLILGLEQGKTTYLPTVSLSKNFNFFIQNMLPELLDSKHCYITDFNATIKLGALNTTKENAVIIGPEGGFTQNEVDVFQSLSCIPLNMGERVLKVETAVTSIAARFL